jgi:signal transduction histidine kinase
MWRSVVNWYREWEEEQLNVLERPELAAQAPAGYRRCFANKLAQLSPLERRQLREFSLHYRGKRLLAALLKLTLLFTLAGAVLHGALSSISWGRAILAANMVGLCITWATIGVWFNYSWIIDRKFGVLGYIVSCAVGGVLLFAATSVLTGAQPLADALERLPRILLIAGLGFGLVCAVPLLIIALLRNRHSEAVNLQLQREAERERLARELSESQLRLLRAQIEPHFLFNTLGAVQQLAEAAAPRAAELTANLITFLRASLTEMRSEQVSLRQEFGLVEAYLQVMKARLGERLQFTLDLPDALAQVPVPSMILLTLAENAIKHGIEPSLRGGAVSVSAQQNGGVACIRVRDSGVGMSPEPGAGLGLDNVRRRLEVAYGAAASLTLREMEPGVSAEVILPIGAATP